jgi:DHA1 family bicyclomycin/chloramphenicol resistance-like MFS transporter
MRKSHKKINQKVLLIVLGILIAIGPLTIDVYLPAFLNISQNLQTNINKVQHTLTSYFIGIVIGQIVFGPIIDRYGKKIPLIFGLVLFIITSLGCAIIKDIDQMIYLRFLQAIAGCSSIVICRAIVRDVFLAHETARAFSRLILVMGLAPILAPFIGNLILVNFNWRYIFVFLAFYALICLILAIYLIPETKGFDHNEKIHHALKKYYRILKDRNFLVNALCGSMMMGCLMSYMTSSPFLYLQYFQTSSTTYSILFSLNAIGFLICSQINHYFLKKYRVEVLINKIILLPLISGILLILLGFIGNQLVLTTIVIFSLVAICGAINPNTSALALMNQAKHTGSASAMFGTIQFISASIFSSLANYFHHQENILPLTIVIGSSGILCFVIQKFNHLQQRKINRKTIDLDISSS